MLRNLANNRKAWGLLVLSGVGFELAALYFQYAMELLPCIMCIYQRTAVFGILFSALPAALLNNLATRIIGYVGWGISAVWGLLIAIEHVDIQTAVNPFFATCEFVPNYPNWAPLHEWLPSVFAATGDCGAIDWSLFNMSMPQWMIVVFSIYCVILTAVLVSRLVIKRAF